MKARKKKDSNDEWRDIAYVGLRDGHHLMLADQMEFQHDNLSTELKTYDQVNNEKHWQDIRERAAIAAMQAILSTSIIQMHKVAFNDTAKSAISFADALVKQLKE